ncbi:MAG: hypothetical protein AB1407_11270 [Spirochaetota bacterium]
MKKAGAFLILVVLAGTCGFAVHSQNTTTVTVGDVVHTLTVGSSTQNGIHLSLTDSFSPPGLPLSDISITANVNDAKALRSLVLRFEASSGFVPSGEIAFVFAGGKTASLYCLPVARPSKGGGSAYQLTFLSDLGALCRLGATAEGATVELNIYSKKNSIAKLVLPKAFFEFLSPQAR